MRAAPASLCPPSPPRSVRIDIPASQAMYSAAWLAPLLMTPLDTSGLLRCIAPEFSALIAANNSAHRHAQVLLRNYDIWSHSVPNNNSVSDILYDAQAAWSMLAYAQSFGSGAPPSVPSLAWEALPVAVNASGFTVPTAGARLVFSATTFTDGLLNATHTLCAGIIGSILAAG